MDFGWLNEKAGKVTFTLFYFFFGQMSFQFSHVTRFVTMEVLLSLLIYESLIKSFATLSLDSSESQRIVAGCDR